MNVKANVLEEIAAGLEAMGYAPISFTSGNIGIGELGDGTISTSEMVSEIQNDGQSIRAYTVVDAVAAVGDMFYGNLFVASDVLRSTAHLWNSTFNDISHLGTMYPAGMASMENMEYITGYNSDGKYDENINAVRVKMHISHESPKYQAWSSFMNISKDAKRTPNVSIFGFYKAKAIHKREIPSGVVIPDSAKHGDYVIAMSDMIPFAVTTCLRGKCDEVAGCGISTGFTKEGEECDSTTGVCDIPVVELTGDDIPVDKPSKEDVEKLERLKKRIKEFKK